jgi:hypothetical protein
MQSSKQALFLMLGIIVLCVFYASVVTLIFLKIAGDFLKIAITFFELITTFFKELAIYIEGLAKL